jgi:hypothetical protein
VLLQAKLPASNRIPDVRNTKQEDVPRILMCVRLAKKHLGWKFNRMLKRRGL